MPPISGHDNVIEKAETHDSGCGGEGARGKHISFAGRWISGRVVVGDSESTTIVPQNAIENLAHRKRRAVDRALHHCLRPSEMVAGIADQHEDALTPLSGQFPLGGREHILRTLELEVHGSFVSHETAQPESSDQCRGLRFSDPLAPCQLFRSRGSEASKAAVLSEERRGQVEGALTSAPVSEHQGKEFPFGQRLRSMGTQSFARPFMDRQFCHQDSHGHLLWGRCYGRPVTSGEVTWRPGRAAELHRCKLAPGYELLSERA